MRETFDGKLSIAKLIPADQRTICCLVAGVPSDDWNFMLWALRSSRFY